MDRELQKGVPNIFKFATSELSQDAFFCWLISWSKEVHKLAYPKLYERSKSFLSLIKSKGLNFNRLIIKDIRIETQYKNIDFFVELNKSIILLFEDKIKSKKHGGQLKKYTEIVEKEFNNHTIIKVYLKSDYVWKKEKKEVEADGFQVVDINEIYDVLKQPIPNNNIYEDFRIHLKSRIDSFESYKSIPYEKWKSDQLIGYYFELTKRINYVNFDKFHRGKDNWFIIDWHHNFIEENCGMSLEIFSGELVIKGHIYNDKVEKKIYQKKLMNIFESKLTNFNVSRLNRIGKNFTMIKFKDFPVLEKKTNIINFEKSVELIKDILENYRLNIKSV